MPKDATRTTAYFTALCLAVTAVLVLWGYLEAGPATSDDLYYEQNVVAGRLGALTSELATGSGRFHHYLHVALTSLPYFLDSPAARHALSLPVFLAAMAGFCLFAGSVVGAPWLGALATLFALAFYQDNWHHNILTAYPLVFDSGLLCLTLAACGLWRYGRGGARGFLAAAVLLSFVACCHFEAFLAYAPLFCALLWLAARGTPRARWGTMAVSCLGFIAFVAASLAYRALHPSQYAGNALAVSDPVVLVRTVWAYSSSALPLGAFPLSCDWINRFPTVTSALVLSLPQFLAQLANHAARLAPSWLALALVSGGLTYHLLARETGPALRLRLVPACLCAYAFVCPNLLIALSPKYQTPAAGGLAWYVTSGFSGYAAAVGLAAAALWLCGRLGGKPAAKRLTAGALAVIVAGVTLATAAVNASVRESKVAAGARWRAATLAAKSPAFAAVPDGALLVAPDLFVAISEEKPRQGYWEDWFAHRSGKRLRVVAVAPAPLPADAPVFALRRLSGPTDTVTAVLLGKVARLGPPNADPYAPHPDAPTLFADKATVTADAGNRYCDLLYQDGGRFRLTPADTVGRAGLAETSLAATGGGIALDSVALVPARGFTPSAPSRALLRFGPGFSAPERAITGDIVWAGEAGELRLRQDGDAPLRARLACTLIALAPVRLAVTGPGMSREIASSGLATPMTLDLTLPPGETRLTLAALPPGNASPKRFGLLGASLSPLP
ncbi:hypothetical protein [Solidesulfovibrio alcoholivorans]|uniref:hypothetical protein n=1 Tax=Solidesulfovibrio alcoholivorans TaxID=81406 RepID=UPI0005C190CA|nr:hypothetical protein [Solidesulfovibrio alcoholivorans]